MRIDYDRAKADHILAMRGLDFARAREIFAVHHFTARNLRVDYGEDRLITVGKLDGRMVVLVWTPRGAVRRIISLSKANDREKARYAQKLGRSG